MMLEKLFYQCEQSRCFKRALVGFITFVWSYGISPALAAEVLSSPNSTYVSGKSVNPLSLFRSNPLPSAAQIVKSDALRAEFVYSPGSKPIPSNPTLIDQAASPQPSQSVTVTAELEYPSSPDKESNRMSSVLTGGDQDSNSETTLPSQPSSQVKWKKLPKLRTKSKQELNTESNEELNKELEPELNTELNQELNPELEPELKVSSDLTVVVPEDNPPKTKVITVDLNEAKQQALKK